MQLRQLAILLSFLVITAFIPEVVRADMQSRLEADKLIKEAMAARETGNFKEAVSLLKKAEKKEGLGKMTLTDINLMLGDLHKSLYKFSEAADYFSKAESLASDTLKYDEILLMEGDLFFITGAYREGLEKINLIKTPSLLSRKYIQKGKLNFGARNYNDAVADFTEVLNLNPDNLAKGNALQNIAFSYWAMDSLPVAEIYFERALPLLKNERHEDYNIALSNQALLNSYMGQHQKAISRIDSATNYFKGDDVDSRIAMRKKAEIYLRAGRREEAAKLFKEYFNKEQKSLIANLPNMSAEERLNYWGKERGDLSRCFLLEDYDAEFLFDAALFRRQTSLLGLKDTEELLKTQNLSAQKIRSFLKGDEAAVQFITYPDTTGQIAYAALLISKDASPEFLPLFSEKYLKEPRTTSRESIIKTLDTENRRTLNELYRDSVVAEKIWGKIFSSISPKTKRIYFTPEGVFNFWGIELMEVPEQRDIELRRINSLSDIPSIRKKTKIRAKNQNVLIAGGLDYDFLPDNDEPAKEGDGREARNILTKHYGGRNVKFSPLPGTRMEADSIAAMLETEAVYQLSEAQLKEIMGNYKLLHLATHGYSMVFGVRTELLPLLDDNQIDLSLYECGIVLTGGNLESEPGYNDNLLSAAEISSLDLSNVDFVVLSACQTAKGEITDEGSAGLLRGLKNAGAQTVIVSLWSVNDTSTMLFMTEMYRLLDAGLDKYQAYRGAIDYLKNLDDEVAVRKFSARKLAGDHKDKQIRKKYNEPYFWAPFILVE